MGVWATTTWTQNEACNTSLLLASQRDWHTGHAISSATKLSSPTFVVPGQGKNGFKIQLVALRLSPTSRLGALTQCSRSNLLNCRHLPWHFLRT